MTTTRLALLTAVLYVLPVHAAESTYDAAYVARVHSEISNWGRWGKDDQRGTLNLITPAKRVAAAMLVREGVSVSMAHPVLQVPAEDSPRPLEHEMIGLPSAASAWAVDRIGIAFHGFGHTHMDAVCHIGFLGSYYNGFPMSATTADGCANNGVEHVAHGIFTRAILIDVPRLRGVDWLEPGTAVMPADLEAWERRTGLRVGSGDAVLVHTGRWTRRAARGPWRGSFAGLHVTVAAWLKARDAAVVGTDGGLDVYPSGVAGVGAPMHVLVLSALGMPVLDTMDLTEVAETAARLRRWEFLLTAAPLRIEGGTGSPMNFIATF